MPESIHPRAGEPSATKSSAPPPSSLTYPSRRSYEALAVFTYGDLLRFVEHSADRTARTPEFGGFWADVDALGQERRERLWAAVRLLSIGRRDEASREAEALVRGLPDEDDGHGVMVARTFAEALLGRLHKLAGSGGNLYLGARPPGAQLRAFELLRLRTPLIPFAYAAANRALLDAVSEAAGSAAVEVTLVDVGVGRGGQIRALLKNPSARRLLRALHVIGVEPDSSVDTGGALQLAEANILSAAEEARIPVTFAAVPKRGEELRAEDLLAARPRGLLLANASLALHHVGLLEHGAPHDRTDVLATLHRAGCERVVLVEPDTNHDQDDLTLRFLYAYRHYGTLAQSLWGLLSPSDAALVWTEFFAAEVRNVITHDGPLRVERHEEAETWVARLVEVGYVVDTPAELVAQSAAPPGFSVQQDGRVCSLRYGDVSVLGVMRGRRAR